MFFLCRRCSGVWTTQQVYLFMTIDIESNISDHQYSKTFFSNNASIVFNLCFSKTVLIRFKNLKKYFPKQIFVKYETLLHFRIFTSIYSCFEIKLSILWVSRKFFNSVRIHFSSVNDFLYLSYYFIIYKTLMSLSLTLFSVLLVLKNLFGCCILQFENHKTCNNVFYTITHIQYKTNFTASYKQERKKV